MFTFCLQLLATVTSVTRLGDFLKFLVTCFLTKVTQLFLFLFGLFGQRYLWSKNCCSHFLGNFWKFWPTFYFNILSHWLWAFVHFSDELILISDTDFYTLSVSPTKSKIISNLLFVHHLFIRLKFTRYKVVTAVACDSRYLQKQL